MIRNEVIYNDFENSDLKSIDGGDIMSFNNTNVIETVTMVYNILENTGDHDYVFISFGCTFMVHGMVISMGFLKMTCLINGS